MSWSQWIVSLVLLPAFAYQLIAIVAAWRQSRRRSHPAAGRFTPAVSILKPIRGLDEGFRAAAMSHAGQRYPEFEMLFGVSDPDDPAVPEIRRLERDGGVPVRLIVCSTRWPNGKTGVLNDLVREARHDVLLVNDSDIAVPDGYLLSVAAPLEDPSVGIVTCLYRASAESLAGRWESLGICCEFALSVMVARLLRVREFGLGATLVFRRETLDRIGGMAAIHDFLADDYQLAKHITELGLNAYLSEVAVETSLGNPTWHGVWQHQVRWARTIRVSRPDGYRGLPTSYAGLWVLVAALAGAWIPAAALTALRLISAFLAGVAVLKSPIARAGLPLILLWDVWAFAVWIAGLAGRTVVWRGQRLALRPDGRIQPAT